MSKTIKEEITMTEKQIYELTPAQDVPYLQCKYTLFKRVINILSSISLSEDIDFDVMKDAFNLVVERNDCLRIKFFKKDKQLKQYFGEAKPLTQIPILKFETKEQQAKFIDKYKKTAIKFLKGKVIEPYFIKTYDNKNMILLKVCHLVLDIYGLNVIYKDLMEVYYALKNGTELPPCPGSYEEVVKKDIERKYNDRLVNTNTEFFTNLLNDNPEPYYTGIHGPNNKIWQKKLSKNHRGMQMFFINNDTEGYCHKIDSDLVTRIMAYCKENTCSPADVLLYTCSLTASKLNNDRKHVLPLNLCNCRASAIDKKAAGTKVQSIACYMKFDYNETFEKSIKDFSIYQTKLYRHVNFEDRDFEALLHKTYRSSWLETYYSLTFSFIPMIMPEGVEFMIYSNGKGALPAYLAQLYDVKNNEITMAYDVQSKITSERDVADFHNMYLNVLKQVMDNPQVKLGDIKI